MATQKIILKTAKARKGTVSRAAIRKAVETVFGATKAAKPARASKATTVKKVRTGLVLPA